MTFRRLSLSGLFKAEGGGAGKRRPIDEDCRHPLVGRGRANEEKALEENRHLLPSRHESSKVGTNNIQSARSVRNTFGGENTQMENNSQLIRSEKDRWMKLRPYGFFWGIPRCGLFMIRGDDEVHSA